MLNNLPLDLINLVLPSLKQILIILLVLNPLAGKLFAQERSLLGVVFDRDSKIRLSRVYIENVRTQVGFYNNTKGEFKTSARAGDLLVARLEGYLSDTIVVDAKSDVVFLLKRKSVRLREVVIKDTLKNPAKQLQETQNAYRDIYRKGNTDMLTGVGPGGVGLSIDALYSLFSREGKNARFLQKAIERDYKESIIDYRFTPNLVQQATGLSGLKLRDFMQQYRPSYTFILEANDYDLLRFIQASYQKYLVNPDAYRLPPLK